MTVVTPTNRVTELIERIRKRYPGWSSFEDTTFTKDEVEYKRDASRTAQELLGEPALRQLISDNKFDDVINRLRQVAQKTNLLFQGVPSSGDLNILYATELNKKSFTAALLNLLHGQDPAPKRLDDYLEYVASEGLPSKWTFPTYYLFLLHPQTEIFI